VQVINRGPTKSFHLLCDDDVQQFILTLLFIYVIEQCNTVQAAIP